MRGLSFSALAITVLLVLSSAAFSLQPCSDIPISHSKPLAPSPTPRPCITHLAFQASGPYSYVVDGSFESYSWSVELGGSNDVMVSTSSLHKVSGGVALNLNTQVEEYAFVYQFLSCNESTYRFFFWVYQASAYGETCVEVTPLHPWLEERSWTRQASVFIIRNNSILVDAWRTTQESDSPLKTLNCSFSLRAWHKIVFDADGVSKTQRVYVDDNLTTTLTSSSGTVFAPEILFIGDISTSWCFGDFYYDDVDLLADVSVLSVSISPSSATASPYQAARFDATARGGKQPYSYQWYVSDTPAGTQSFLSYVPISYATQTIRVNVTDAEGRSQTAQAMLNPQTLWVSVTPFQGSVEVNHSKYFSASANGGVPRYSYQWYVNDTPVSGASYSSWIFTPTEPARYIIRVGVTDSHSTSVFSENATLEAFPAQIPVSRDYELVEATIEGGGPSTVDPAFCYDTASGELLQNVYDTLVFYDGEHVDRFIPQLAESWIVQNITGTSDPETGLDWYYRYVFKIRQDVPFHNATFGYLTPEDVEYCFERSMVLDMDGGPQWMFYEPLLNCATATYVGLREYDPENSIGDRILVGKMIDHAVESNATHVWFNLAFPGVYPQLMQILTQPWSSIYSKAWANSLNRPTMWPGEWGDYTGWWVYHNPDTPPLDYPTPALMGTGPFVFIRIDNLGKEWVTDRFVDYWRGWPLNWPEYAGSRPEGFVDRLRVTWAYDWNTRSQMFLNGEIDFCAVPRQYISQMLGQPGIRCTYPLPSLALDAVFFQFNINSTSPYGPILPTGTFNESGVPTDFFGNTTWGLHVRKAFASVIDYDSYISTWFLGEAVHPTTAIIPALPYYDATVKGYSFNLARAAEELKQVPGLWDTGFSLTLLYNVGGLPRQFLPEMIASNINSLNPKFHVQAVGLYWSSYLAASNARQLPVFPVGWLADYPDPHNLAYPYYDTYGNFAFRAHYSNPTMDSLIDEGIRTPDGPERAAIYSQVQQLAVDDCPCVPLATSIYRHFERNWVCGWYCNPAYPGVYAATVWKWYYVPQALNETAFPPTSDCLSFDINYDGKVNMYDIGAVAASFGAEYGPPTRARWIFRCDLNNDRKINMLDIGMVARYVGKTAVPWVPPP